MICPKCNKLALDFFKWGSGKNAFSTHCNECNVKLKANLIVYIGFILTVLPPIILVPYRQEVLDFLNLSHVFFQSKLGLLVIVSPIILGFGFLTWFLGGYKVKE